MALDLTACDFVTDCTFNCLSVIIIVTSNAITFFLFARDSSSLQLHVLLLGFDPQNLPFPGGQGLQLTQCVFGPMKWHLDPSNGLRRVHECDRQTTDHATEKCVGTGEITCTRTVSPNNAAFV